MTNDMTVGSPAKHILFFTIPILLGNVFQQLYSMVDTIIVGKFINADALAAVGLTGALSFLILGFVFGITSGFAVVASQAFGAKDEEALRNSIATSIVLSVIITILLTVLSIGSTRFMLTIMNTPENIFEDAYIYILIIYIGIGCSMLYNMLACILRALGDSKTPLYFLIISSLLNIVLDLLFIISFHMGVAGAALATIIAQGVSGVLLFIYAKKHYPILSLHRSDFKLTKHGIKKHLALGLPMAFQFSITALGVMILQSALNLFGSAKIAAFTAASKVEQLVSQPAGTFGTAVATYAGQNHGAGNPERIRDGIRKAILLSLLCSVVASIIVVCFGRNLTSMFLDGSHPDIVNDAQIYLTISAIFFPFLHLLFIHRNALQGIGRSFVPMMAGVAELVVRGIAAFTLPSILAILVYVLPDHSPG